MDLDELLTTVVITHYSPREAYGNLSPPSAGIVSETIRSARSQLQGLSDCHIDLYYFHPSVHTADSRQYYRNLKRFVQNIDKVTLHSDTNEGLRKNLVKIINNISSKYSFIIEHDWRFLEHVDVHQIISTMEEFSQINCIRFNKYKNVVKRWNTVVEPDPTLPIQLCKVSSFTNQPHISRTRRLREWIPESEPDPSDWIKALRRDPYPEKLSFSDLGKIASEKYMKKRVNVYKLDDFEYFIDTNYKYLIKQIGFRQAHKRYGIYLYGLHASGPYVEHLGR